MKKKTLQVIRLYAPCSQLTGVVLLLVTDAEDGLHSSVRFADAVAAAHVSRRGNNTVVCCGVASAASAGRAGTEVQSSPTNRDGDLVYPPPKKPTARC